ncbi:hypothetical protein L1987_19777 [Smallanthus sonchifolius]|uniref:Uncharacterized protein n=1 Tax=Smallanthus sonchifolius TaxID=185202 RepID=A0ACB9IQS2_9ASTR|nr:hypothetical protein L1987_19777 [Smallanthus sonchifolius]
MVLQWWWRYCGCGLWQQLLPELQREDMDVLITDENDATTIETSGHMSSVIPGWFSPSAPLILTVDCCNFSPLCVLLTTLVPSVFDNLSVRAVSLCLICKWAPTVSRSTVVGHRSRHDLEEDGF